ncbi:MAG: 2-dehydro-3-deoxygalactonokinase [Roseovarius sp.]
MSIWIALGREAEGYVGYAVQGAQIMAQAQGADAGAVRDQLHHPNADVVRIGVGEADVLPAAVLPSTGQTVPPLHQDTPADVISAWVRIWGAGYLAAHPNWDGVMVVLHGDVVHWLHVSADEIVSSASSLTPRLFAVLAMGNAVVDEAAMADTLSRPERLMTHLRSAEVRGDAGACLGHFIGADLAAMRAYWLGQQAVVIGDGPLAQAYTQALGAQGVPAEHATPDALLPGGLAALGAHVFAE